MKKILLSIVGLLLVLWVTGIILENFFNVDLDKYFNGSPSAPQAAAPPPAAETAPESPPSDWITYKNDDFHFSAASPYELYETQSSEPTTVKSLKAKGHSPDMKFVVQVTANEMPGIALDLNKAADQEIKMFKLMDKVMTNLQISSSPVTVADTPGVLLKGTYQVMGKIDQEMVILNIKKGTTLLNLMVQYTPTDENKAMADKVLHSLIFTN
jgi:hypothetical protein